jgi:hypothetical protein
MKPPVERGAQPAWRTGCARISVDAPSAAAGAAAAVPCHAARAEMRPLRRRGGGAGPTAACSSAARASRRRGCSRWRGPVSGTAALLGPERLRVRRDGLCAVALGCAGIRFTPSNSAAQLFRRLNTAQAQRQCAAPSVQALGQARRGRTQVPLTVAMALGVAPV